MRITGLSDSLKVNATGCIVLPASLFAALMLATAGAAVWPKLAAPGAAILCGSGEVVYESRGGSYRPGEYTITREIRCRNGSGKAAPGDDITLQALGVSFLAYALVIFLLLQFVLRPIVVRRLRRRLAAFGPGGAASSPRPGTPAASGDLADILARVQAAVQRGEADVRIRNVTADPGPEAGGGDIAARLAQLKALRDQGLITAGDYEAKKAEILAGL